MCGICGEFRFDDAPVSRDNVHRMMEALIHRGPDDSDAFVQHEIGLGHRRLTILDLSERGRQPMWSADRSLCIVFNGEIYNFREIRDELAGRGYRFDSETDTEVVLSATHCWGIDGALRRFIGMFAFALWDATAKELLLVRDRVGIKPLYYSKNARRLLFGSELKGVLAHPEYEKDIDRTMVAQFLVVGYTVGEQTIFHGTKKVAPGHYLRVKADGDVETHRYWTIADFKRGSFSGTIDDACEELLELCESAFAYRLVADVPVGVFLSGGTDSSLVSAVLAKRVGASLVNFTIGFSEGRFDETTKAAKVASQLGIEHVVQRVDPVDALEALSVFTEIYDEPFGDTSGIPTYLLSKLAREHVKVALSADGGDELFCGYPSYFAYGQAFSRARRFPSPMRIALAWVLDRVVPRCALAAGSDGSSRSIARFEKLTRILGIRTFEDLLRAMHEKGWTESRVQEVVRGSINDMFENTALANVPEARDMDEMIDRMMHIDFSVFLVDDILTKVDRASMYASLECRAPLLDHRIAEFAASLPMDFLVGGGEHKKILKRLLRTWISDDVVDAPKIGFSIPLYDWLRGPWQPLVRDYLDPSRVRAAGILDEAVVSREVGNFYRHRGWRAERVMLMVLFQMWVERWYLN